jgi:predicted metal-binding protein
VLCATDARKGSLVAAVSCPAKLLALSLQRMTNSRGQSVRLSDCTTTEASSCRSDSLREIRLAFLVTTLGPS